MRRHLFMLLFLIVLVLPVFCDEEDVPSSNATLAFSAYKNPPLPDLSYVITISNNLNENIQGTTEEFKLNKYNSNVPNALTVKINTNLSKNINVDIWFYPFVNEYDSYDIFPATYTTSASLMSSNTVECEYNSINYRYSGTWTLTGFTASNSTYTIKPLTGSGIHGRITSKIVCEKEENGSWVSVSSIPSQNNVICGFTKNQFVENTITFSMKANFPNNQIPEPNMKYSARIRLVITEV